MLAAEQRELEYVTLQFVESALQRTLPREGLDERRRIVSTPSTSTCPSTLKANGLRNERDAAVVHRRCDDEVLGLTLFGRVGRMPTLADLNGFEGSPPGIHHLLTRTRPGVDVLR